MAAKKIDLDQLKAKLALEEAERTRITFASEQALSDLKREEAEIRLERARLELEADRLKAARTRAASDQHGAFTFMDMVERATVQPVLEDMYEFSRRKPKAPITVVFNSPGGSVFDGLALYDTMEDLKRRGHHLTTVVRGVAASMGGVLMQAGHERLIGPHAFLMIHEVSIGSHGKTSLAVDQVELARRLQDRLLTILTRRSTLTKADVRKLWHKNDWWLDARQAVKLGFADRSG